MRNLIILMLFFLGTSCNKNKGCTDRMAITYDVTADKNVQKDCMYSIVTFYKSTNVWLNPDTNISEPIEKVEVFIISESIGEVTNTFIDGPGNCSSFGTVSHSFIDGNPVDWNALITLESGKICPTGGITQATPDEPCLKIDVTSN